MRNAKDRTLPAHRLTPLVIPSPSLIPLRPGLWFDSNACILLRDSKPYPLTAREVAVLSLLLQAPSQWHLADDLAHQLKRRWPQINAHCVEQTICGLRQKLGERGQHPRILRNRYGLGYRIVPEVSSDSVILPIHNTAGTTNLYTFMLTQPTDATGKITAAEQAEQSTFEAMLDTFTLPASVAAVDPSGCPEVAGSPGSAVSPACSYPCTAVCWADANWRYTYYDDSSGSYSIYCNGGTYNNSYSANPQCSTGNQPGAQVPSANDQYWQPNFQCADFVSRALVENYQIAGLGNGGVSGQFPATSPNASGYSYQYYEFTYTPYSSDTTYDLIDVGVPGILGLYDYLINSGLGTNIHQNIAAARPGDVLFLYNGSISPSNRAHVVLITSTFQQSNGQWDALIDGHNVAVYHDDFQKNWIPYYGNNYEIIHMRGSLTGSSGQSTRYGAGWTNFTDGYGQSSSWVSTTNAQNATAWAQFPDSSEATPCAIAVYVPDGSATANLTFGVEMADGSWTYRTVNENNIDGWALLFKWGDLNATRTLINVGNNNGTTTQKMGVGAMAFLC